MATSAAPSPSPETGAEAGAEAAAAPAGAVLARTSAGVIAGERSGRLSVFRGVPYAAPPVGTLRFASPRPPEPWSGVRDATAFAPESLQPIIPGSGEDSLYANVWTPAPTGSVDAGPDTDADADEEAAKPVLVYIHGGGWMVGGGSLPVYDGARLADRGDLVVVTFNYRLGALGFGLHEEFTDSDTGDFANWGLQDQAALLRWVYENAAAFGGDPGNITVAGTSAGGASTWQFALLPELRGIIRRIVPISACHVWEPATSMSPADSRQAYEAVARRLGTTVAGLREVPAAALMDAWEEVFGGLPGEREVGSGREFRGPVVDGRWMSAFDYELPTPEVPVLAVHTRTEGSFYTGPCPPQPTPTPPPTDAAELREAVRGVLEKGMEKVPYELTDACIAAYREAAEADGLPRDPLSLWTEIWGDALFRYQIVRLSERHARHGRSPQYVMEFAQPVRAPHHGTPHEATSPFLFGTYADPAAISATYPVPETTPLFHDGPHERAVSETFMDLVAAFARDGVPTGPGAPAWPVFDPEHPSTLVLGGERIAEIATTSKLRQLRFWDESGWVPRT
ncbi:MULTISPECIES: carboxylesterase family protein [unclassified Streptomyces]|uniref:carboxylesterase family protein n=1 Tax=unclassified Streptomyces TaxID=2593676 RepID=UPI002E1684B9|nr:MULTISPECIES: carboxylesterase family protein [unclassified Streptomyces]WSR27046.1 carboxylesterase family protein [Streptomyces sp. NBC_01205]